VIRPGAALSAGDPVQPVALACRARQTGLRSLRRRYRLDGPLLRQSEPGRPPVEVREDSAITFQWGEEPPFPGWEPDGYSARWVRSDRFEEGVYRFAFRCDDGLRLYFDVKLFYENWVPGSFDWREVDRRMSAGLHRLTVEYFEDTGIAFVQVGYALVEE